MNHLKVVFIKKISLKYQKKKDGKHPKKKLFLVGRGGGGGYDQPCLLYLIPFMTFIPFYTGDF